MYHVEKTILIKNLFVNTCTPQKKFAKPKKSEINLATTESPVLSRHVLDAYEFKIVIVIKYYLK